MTNPDPDWKTSVEIVFNPKTSGDWWTPLHAMCNADGRLEVFGYKGGKDSREATLVHQWMTDAQDPKSWYKVETLGDGLSSASLDNPKMMAVAKNGDGRLEVFASQGNGVKHCWQTSPNGGWSKWGPMPDFPAIYNNRISNIQCKTNKNGSIEVFAKVGLEGFTDIWHCWQTSSSSSGWSDWGRMYAGDGNFGDIAVGQNDDGRLEVFMIDGVGMVWHTWQDSNSKSGWSTWGKLGAAPSPVSFLNGGLSVARNGSGKLELFAFTNGDFQLCYHKWQNKSASGWSDWEKLLSPNSITKITGSIPATLSPVLSNYESKLYVAGTFKDSDGNTNINVGYQETSGTGGWSDARTISMKNENGAIASIPVLAQWQDVASLIYLKYNTRSKNERTRTYQMRIIPWLEPK